MSQDREPRYADFIHRHEARLNLIYSRWEAQIEKQSAANRPQTLVGKIKSHKKTALAVMAMAFGSVFLACQHGKQIDYRKSLIASNSHQLDHMTWDLQHKAISYPHLPCYQNGTTYQLISGSPGYYAFTKEPSSFLSQSQTISVIKHSADTRQPNIYFRLNADRNMLFSSTEQTDDNVQTITQVIDLDPDLADLSTNREATNNYTQIQEQAIALHKEFAQCLSNPNNLGFIPPFPQTPYAD